MKTKKRDIVAETKQYVEFLQKRLASENYKANVSQQEYAETKAKYDKAKLRLKLLTPKK